jgi:hypothetical protein
LTGAAGAGAGLVGGALELLAAAGAAADVVGSADFVSDPHADTPTPMTMAAMAMMPARTGKLMSSPVRRPPEPQHVRAAREPRRSASISGDVDTNFGRFAEIATPSPEEAHDAQYRRGSWGVGR